MPTLKELYEALERADAAGDAESARELAAYIKGVQGAQSGGFKEELIPLSTEETPKNLDSSIFDIPISLGRGAVQGFRFIADSFGADNPVSNALRGTENYLADLMSAQAKADSAEIGRIMKEAEDKGVGDQLLAAIKALSIAPVDLLTQALGTAAPTIIGGLAGIALRGGTVAARAISSGIGASMGAGVVKSTIYDAVEGVSKKLLLDNLLQNKRQKKLLKRPLNKVLLAQPLEKPCLKLRKLDRNNLLPILRCKVK
jgi:hypothetical protein